MDIDVEGVRQSEWERNAHRKSTTRCRCVNLELLTTSQVGCAVLIVYEFCWVYVASAQDGHWCFPSSSTGLGGENTPFAFQRFYLQVQRVGRVFLGSFARSFWKSVVLRCSYRESGGRWRRSYSYGYVSHLALYPYYISSQSRYYGLIFNM
jgi:hypothetical protein